MSVAIQEIKRSRHLSEWAEMVRSCKNSGMTVRAWCLAQGLNEKTYYYRQKQLCNALPERTGNTVQFAEVSRPEMNPVLEGSVQIRVGAAEIRVDNNTDLTLLRDVLRVVAQTC